MNLVGKELIDFELSYVGRNGLEMVKLSDEVKHSNILLLFFPAAWTSVCTNELSYMRDHMQEYANLNVTVYGISTDLPWALNKFKEELELNFLLLSDANKEVIRSYGVAWPNLAGIKDTAHRSAFIIKKGIISYVWIGTDQKEFPPFEIIKNELL